MKTIRSVAVKRAGKQDRERKVLLALVEYYIQTGHPVGSNTLKEVGIGDLSSATIRNYFAGLEEEGYLTQTHTSGGRIPTFLGYRSYAENYIDADPFSFSGLDLRHLKQFDSREITLFLQEAAESLSKLSRCAVFLSAPRFDHDFITLIKLIPLDITRCLCVLVTDFGVVKTEILHLPENTSPATITRIERYFHWRLTGVEEKEHLEPQEELIAQNFYNELMLRYVVGYSNFIDEELYRTGFSRLLTHSDFEETSLLTSGLSLFENVHAMRLLLKECTALERLKCWIGDDLDRFVSHSNCTVIAIPYSIHHKIVGAIGILGPVRLPYRTLFNTLRQFADCITETLTRNIYKFKISYRHPETRSSSLFREETKKIVKNGPILLT